MKPLSGKVTLPVVFSLLSLIISGGSFWSTRQTQRMVQRAYLKVIGGRVLRLTDEDGQNAFEVQVENTGNTPAYIDSEALRLFVVQESLHQLPMPESGKVLDVKADDLGQRGHSLVVSARSKAVVTTFSCFCVKQYEPSQIVLLGHLAYRDSFGEAHYENWGWSVDLTEADVTDDLPNNIGAYNTARESVDDETVQAIFRGMKLSL